MDRLFIQIQVLKADASQSLARLFQNKVLLEEQTRENEVQIQFHRGVISGLEQVCKEITRICTDMQREEIENKFLEPRQVISP